MKTETATKQITQSGDSLVINVTKEVKRMGLKRGDSVNVVLSSNMSDYDTFVSWVVDNALSCQDMSQDDTGAYTAPRATVEKIADHIANCVGDDYTVGLNAIRDLLFLDVFVWLDDQTTSVIRSIAFYIED